ncbi:MAG: sigma-54 dependent transcriptional regulator [Thermodesulfobacteriota bacterium]|nr:MAG: sigma-54 dependent transcriptional regulator [Thermodesulfobacteriota bacterium]
MKVMIIDDEDSMRHMLSVMLKMEGYEAVAFDEAAKALGAIEADDYDFVLCDIRMPGMDGLEFLKGLKDKKKEQTVIMMSAYGTIDTAIECMKLGAYDYISKPFKQDEIVLTLRKAEERERLKRENIRLKKEAAQEYDVKNIITVDPRMLEILELAKKISNYSTTVLITGGSGTGKELVARAIHTCGSRAPNPFVAVNCGAIPGNLLESELFGHVRGAFTDAHKTKVGLFEEAHGGTLFLDEVGELPMELQVKLLRVLQEGEVRKVGDTKSVKVDTRVVAATLKDLKAEAAHGRFREDLLYRLNVIEIDLPPLRERPGDIEALAQHFVRLYARNFRKPIKGIKKDALKALVNYSWPGNVRELENVIERAMILEDSDMIKKESLPMGVASPEPSSHFIPSNDLSIKKAEETLEREYIKKALEKTKNNKTRAAELLEISHRALLYKIKSFGL